MEAEYATRKQQWREECQVAPEIFAHVMPRVATCMAPFVDPFCRQEPSEHAPPSVCGLLSDVARKNVESIASRFGQDRLPLQRFMGWAAWDDAPLRQELTRQVAEQWGHADGVLVCDPSAFVKSGPELGGVARQWLDNAGVPHDRRGDRTRHHQTLSLMATWFFGTETRRGEKMDTRHDVPPDAGRYRVDPVRGMPVRHNVPYAA